MLCVMGAGVTFAGNYRLDEASINNAFDNATELTVANPFDVNAASMLTDEEPTKMGFLLRAYFCGFVGLHRSYMGTGGKTLWYYYLCIPVGGSVVGCVDFWGVVFKGDEFMAKFKDNPKWVVWKS